MFGRTAEIHPANIALPDSFQQPLFRLLEFQPLNIQSVKSPYHYQGIYKSQQEQNNHRYEQRGGHKIERIG